MSDDQLDDLKQFVAATVSQSEQRIKDELKKEIKKVREEVAEGFAGVGEAIEEIHKQSSDVDIRLTKLEQQAA